MFRALTFALIACTALAAAPEVLAQPAPPPAPCGEVPGTPSKKPKPLWKATPLMFILNRLEARGEAEFRLAWSPPASQCLVETLDVGGVAFSAVHATFVAKAGDELNDRLMYRFSGGEGDGARDVLVLHDPVSSVFADVHLIYVAEMRGGYISYYAMFNGLPTYETLRQTVAGVLDGSARPLAVVNWEPGAKEGTIDAYDGDRLKK